MSSTILLLRHAEEASEEGSMDLSAGGRRRATRLANYLPREFGPPHALFVAEPSGASVRCYLTLRPLADALALRIDGSYKAREFGLLAWKLLADPELANKTIVVCWSHTDLPALATALGVVGGDFPRRWKDETFNLIVRLTHKQRGSTKAKSFVQPF